MYAFLGGVTIAWMLSRYSSYAECMHTVKWHPWQDPAYRFGLTNLVKYGKMASLAGSGL
jgi:hypothetical protein